MKTNYSRRELYAHGEPLGECVTRRKLGGGYVCGGGGGGGSSASTNNSEQADNRIANESGAAISGDGSSITINSTDGGIVSRALDSIDVANATAGMGFTKLLDTTSSVVNAQNSGFNSLLSAADKLFSKGESLITSTQQGLANAYSTATTEKGGTIDNKTIIVLAVAGAAAVFALRGKK